MWGCACQMSWQSLSKSHASIAKYIVKKSPSDSYWEKHKIWSLTEYLKKCILSLGPRQRKSSSDFFDRILGKVWKTSSINVFKTSSITVYFHITVSSKRTNKVNINSCNRWIINLWHNFSCHHAKKSQRSKSIVPRNKNDVKSVSNTASFPDQTEKIKMRFLVKSQIIFHDVLSTQFAKHS